MSAPWIIGHRRCKPEPYVGAGGDAAILALNPVLWLDASDLSTFSLRDVSGTKYVEEWRDKSGNGNHAVQGVLANQPKFANAKVIWDAVQSLNVPNPPKIEYMLAVAEWDEDVATNGYIYYLVTTGGNREGVYRSGSATRLTFVWINNSTEFINIPFDKNVPFLVESIFSNDFTCYVNNNKAVNPSNNVLNQHSNMYIGNSSIAATNGYMHGNIREVMGFSTYNVITRENLTQYLSQKHAITLA